MPTPTATPTVTPIATAAVEAHRAEPQDSGSPGDLDRAAEVFLGERTRLLRVARRVVGDPASAEDVVQEAWLRWQRVDRRRITNPAAFLTTATTHLAINLVQSARHRHEVPTERPRAERLLAPDPTEHVELAAAVERTLTFLAVKLTPAELAAFVLRKCFDFPYDEVAHLLGTSAANARQLVRRAHLALHGSRVRAVDQHQVHRLVAAFVAASEDGDFVELIALLGDGVTAHRCSGPGATKDRAGHARRSLRAHAQAFHRTVSSAPAA
jgi:RNA polymerase sigma-70 factor (ECF subfamily)